MRVRGSARYAAGRRMTAGIRRYWALRVRVVMTAEQDWLSLLAREVESLADILIHALRAVRGNVMGAGGGGERRLVERLIVPFGIDRSFAGEHDQRDSPARRHRQRRHDLREAGPASDGCDADLPGREVIPHGHGTGAMLVPCGKRVHALKILHRCRPVHISVSHEGEVGGDAFGSKGLGQCFVDRHVLHCGDSVWLGMAYALL